jgi:uncharacterized protein YciW
MSDPERMAEAIRLYEISTEALDARLRERDAEIERLRAALRHVHGAAEEPVPGTDDALARLHYIARHIEGVLGGG